MKPLRGLCVSRRARSISELTRGAVLQQLSEDSPSPRSVSDDMITLISALERIDGELRDIRGRILGIVSPAVVHAEDNSPLDR